MRRRALVVCLALASIASACSYETRDFDFDATLPETSQTSFVFAADGTLITDLKAEENRINKRIDEIPEILQHAVVAIEDERFYLHKGFDFRGIVRAARSNVSAGGISEGGSTITQQYVGNVFLDRGDQTASRKIEEIMLARSFENQFGKDAILELYLNWVYFGNNAYGVQAAAEEYFDKDVEDVTLTEAALLAGLIQRPSTYDPFRNPGEASRRRELVLDRMLANEYITDEEHEEALGTPVTSLLVDRSDEDLAFGNRYPAGHFVEEVKAWFLSNPEFGETYQEREDLLFRGGVQIHTTIDLELQAEAEAAVEAIIPVASGGPDAAATVLDNTEGRAGAVLAMVGGRDFFGDSEFARVNLAMGKGRQAGSAMKPIALAAALDSGAFEVTSVYPAPGSIEIPIPGVAQPWRVKGGPGGRVDLIRATRSSYNTVYAQLMRDIGPERFVEMAHRLGVRSDIAPVLAAVLGTEDVTTLDMATAFSTFANRGTRYEPFMVDRIVNADGTTLWEHQQQGERAISANIADQISWVLTGVIASGTGTGANIGRPAAGKTGTAQNSADATFVGFTPQRTTAVWVGFPEGQIPMTTATVGRTVFGGNWPADIWREIMVRAMDELPVEEFPEPPPSTTSTTIPVPAAAVEVPNVVGMDQATALATLGEAGLEGVPAEVETNEFAPGTVMNQAPPGGAVVRGDQKITLEVAIAFTPDEPAMIPDVLGASIQDATSILASSGYVPVVIYQDSGGAADVVWQQSPAGGTAAATGAEVTVYVNIG